MNLLLTNASIVTVETNDTGYLIKHNHFINIINGKIAQIGGMASCPLASSGKQLDCEHKLLTPGFIDCHTHLVFAGNRANEFEQRLTGVPYQEIARQGGGIMTTVNATRKATEAQLLEKALQHLSGLIKDGVTTVEIKSGYGLDLESELKILRVAKQIEQQANIKVSTTLLAAHAVPLEFKDNPDRYIDYVCNTIIPAAVKAQLVDYVDIFCEGIGFNLKQTERVFKSALSFGLGIKGHTEQLSNSGGSALAAKMGASSVDHLEYLDETGVKALADNGTVATLLPGAFYFLRETQLPPVELLRTYKVPIALATDFNPGTSPIASLLMIMNMGCTLFGLTPEEALRGVTCHAAKALGLAQQRGQIKVGFEADLCLWNIQHPAQLAYEIGTNLLISRIINGVLCND
ncbi:imidazolonepropionase [Psychromonas ingrahamii 37]|uniref:Imidazolonepropionase n=1 Tax=Psychromonas ingrahamii (strain DSM 17664 / CCUG 51855 / 37) TaxID=357804 RepID=HUTI_PSYIN|nr:imidazolonepropionase [Psychromonas ingrahamii]A1STQ6.1 RecName: Full=Imidazolonepropionase; AltName: Full=Imidazolone-5-propionate hydrolase [Psychromonas ingrahamii 37]ABM02871.1 imidazolonepropionase [Psychromonas ingrahamii 37]